MGLPGTLRGMSTMASPDDTPVRNRTRFAILNAAISVLTVKPAAALSEIADQASVARSTLHRYFPDRDSLMTAVNAFAADQVEVAIERARLGEGLAADALIRLCHEYFDHWQYITWQYLEWERQSKNDCEEMDQTEARVTAMIERGYADGTIDPEMSNGWVQQMVGATLYTAWEYVRLGQNRHEVLREVERTMLKIVRPE